eukprot:Seg2881.8 transcript_id=Seg2881.8/GoldUCD/mRNA.D3Y31 product="G2/M phase-specific E3 ubiquitin-protein ligase" protein_id=Seg2881.8/GoldUCD/D3Y31
MARDERAEEANARLESLLRAVSTARGLATVSTAPSPNINVNDYLQQAFPTIRGRQEHHPEQTNGTHPIDRGGSSAWPIGGNHTIREFQTPRVVPKGKARELLFSSGLVLSSFNLNTAENEATIRNKLEEGFKDMLRGISSSRKFEFVRAVERKIVPIKVAGELNGRAIYSIAGQRERPVYIRASEDIRWRLGSDSTLFESDSDDSVEEILQTTSITFDQTKNEINFKPAGLADENKEECPICHKSFPVDALESHANTCIDLSEFRAMNFVEEESKNEAARIKSASVSSEDEEKPLSLEEFLRIKETNFCAQSKTTIAVRIRKAYPDAVQKIKLFFDKTPLGPISVDFVGEVAVDDGGPLREFFTIIFEAAPSHVLTGNRNNYTLRHDAHKLENGDYYMYGKFVALSLLQGGPGPHNWCKPLAQYVLGLEPTISVEHIPDYEVQAKLGEIQQCADEEEFTKLLQDLDERFDAGYNKLQVTLSDKEDLIRKLSRYFVISRQLEEIHQMCKGLDSFGLLDGLKEFAESAMAEFVYEPEALKSSLIKEMYQWYQFLDELEVGMKKDLMVYDIDALVGKPCTIDLQAVLRFLTGSKYPPVTFANKKVGQITFLHGCPAGRRISVSTCLVRIVFPVNDRYVAEHFAKSMSEDIVEGPGFGLV